MHKVVATPTVSKKSLQAAWIANVLFAILFCVAMLGRPASAQTGQQFVGHVEDPSHASVAGANVTIHNEGTGEDIVVKATGAGDYTAPYLKIGDYTLTADMPGFKTVSKTHIHLDTDQTSKIDFTLPIGAVTETVTVNSSGSQIELSKADRGTIIDGETVVEMPSNGRNVLELFNLSPGTINNHGTADTSVRPEDNVAGDLYANGSAVVGSGSSVQENIDGATNDNAGGFLGYPPPPDAVAEFKVVLNPYDASYGRAGAGAIDITLKSGTNKVHGALYDFVRRPWLDANSNSYNHTLSLYQSSTNQCPAYPAVPPLGCVSAPAVSAHKRDQFGAELDGPVYIPHIYNGKDKTFFTLQWEQVYEDVPSGGLSTVSIPSPAEFGGDFSNQDWVYTYQAPSVKNSGNLTNLCGLPAQQPQCHLPLGIFDPTKAVTLGVKDPNDGQNKDRRQQFLGNNCGDTSGNPITCLIPKNYSLPAINGGTPYDPIAMNLAQYYLQIKPNYNAGPASANNQNNYAFQPLEHDYAQNGLFKIDQNFGTRDRGTIRWEGFVRYSNDLVNGIDPSNPANQELSNVQPKDNNFAIEEIHTFSPNLILDNKITLLNERQNRRYGVPAPGILQTLGFSPHYLANSPYPNLFPDITVGDNPGAVPLGPGSTGNSNPQNSNNIAHNLSYQPSVTYIRGRHSFRGGLDMRLTQFANPGGTNGPQSLSYNRGFTSQYVGSKGDATGFTSGSGVADLLLGYPSGAGVKFSIDPFYSQHYYGVWLQDDWKATPKMTLNFGVRWDILTPRVERHNKVNSGFDFTDISPVDAQITNHADLAHPLTGGLLAAGVDGNPRGSWKINWFNIQPRFGFAYAFSPRTSIRAGFAEQYINNETTDSNASFVNGTSGFNTSLTDNASGVVTDNTFPAPQKPGYGSPEDPFALGYAKPAFICGSGPTCTNPNGSPITRNDELLASAGGGVSFDDPNLKIPSIWDFSVSLEQLLSRRDVLDISYSGTKAYNLGETINLNMDSPAWNAQCDILRGGNHNICDSSKVGAGRSINPFVNASAFYGTGQGALIGTNVFTRAYPQFGSVNENNVPTTHSWYNSMQVTASHNASKSLTMRASLTWSKAMKAGNLVDAVNGVKGRTISTNDTPIVITFSGVFYVPVGRGKALLGNTNRIVDAVIGGWEISPLYVYTAGKPQGPGGNWDYYTKLAIPAHDLPYDAAHPTTQRIQGITPCAAVRVDPDFPGTLDYGQAYTAAGCTAPAAIQRPAYSVSHNIVYTGIRSAAIHEFDVSLSKNFAWNSAARLQLRLDAFNVLNHNSFSGGYSTDWSSIDFGTYNKSTSNGAYPSRELQLSGKIQF